MLLGFKNCFVPFVLDGSKTHTIRAKRFITSRKTGSTTEARPKPGSLAHCYSGLRQTKPARLLGRFVITRVEDMRITRNFQNARAASYEHEPALNLWIGGRLIEPDEAELFFHRDGFRGDPDEIFKYRRFHYPYTQQAAEYRDAQEGGGEPFEGYLIHWKFPA